MWIATVDNIDWPKTSTSDQTTKQNELLTYLDLMVEMNMNTVFFQVRPHGDALYVSSIEPWSEYLTGTQGVDPSPSWDPLDFMVRESHARGIELHAWLNPYRARKGGTKDELATGHMCLTMSKYCYDYGPDLWMDPAVPAVQDRFIGVVLDIVTRLEINANLVSVCTCTIQPIF